jgi:hypothetical protein
LPQVAGSGTVFESPLQISLTQGLAAWLPCRVELAESLRWPSPNGGFVQIGKLIACFGKILRQGWTPSKLIRQDPRFLDHPGPVRFQLRLQILQYDSSGFLVEAEVAVSWQPRDPRLNLSDDLLSRTAEERSEPLVEAKLTPLVSDEVQHQATGLAGVQTKPAAQLLKKTVELSVGRRKKTQSISGMSTPSLKRSTVNKTFTSRLRNMEAAHPFLCRRTAVDGRSGYSGLAKYLSHKPRTSDRHAEAKRSSLAPFAIDLAKLAQDEIGAAGIPDHHFAWSKTITMTGDVDFAIECQPAVDGARLGGLRFISRSAVNPSSAAAAAMGGRWQKPWVHLMK